jgi:hypothetical protein
MFVKTSDDDDDDDDNGDEMKAMEMLVAVINGIMQI